MGKLVTKYPEYMDLSNMEIHEISPYEEVNPILVFKNALKKKLDQSQIVANEIYNIAIKEASALSNMPKDGQEKFNFILDLDDLTKTAIDSGELRLVTNKAGEMIAQYREPNGNFGKQIPIKKEYLSVGVDPIHAMTTLQLNALQDQLQEVADQIYNIEKSVYEVLKGLQNDRIGQFYSGMALYSESISIMDKDLRKAVLSHAIKSLTDATYQLKLNLHSDITYLENKEYKGFKGKQVEKIDSKIRGIHQSFAIIHQATMMKAGIYCELDEIQAMTAVLNEYAGFIENVIVKNSNMLAQCDPNDNGSETGIWEQRAHLKLDVTEFAKQISGVEKTIYLSVQKEIVQWLK